MSGNLCGRSVPGKVVVENILSQRKLMSPVVMRLPKKVCRGPYI